MVGKQLLEWHTKTAINLDIDEKQVTNEQILLYLAQQQVKNNDLLHSVSNQRELLIGFKNDLSMLLEQSDKEQTVDDIVQLIKENHELFKSNL